MRYIAVRKYFKKLFPELSKRYGARENYTAGQIKKTVDEAKFSKKYLPYAYALFMTKEEFIKVIESEFNGEDFLEIRTYIADRFFGGDIEYLYKTVTFSVHKGSGIDSMPGGVHNVD